MQGHKEDKSCETGIRNNTLKLSVWQLKGRNGPCFKEKAKDEKLCYICFEIRKRRPMTGD